jgi:hypothetical protein
MHQDDIKKGVKVRVRSDAKEALRIYPSAKDKILEVVAWRVEYAERGYPVQVESPGVVFEGTCGDKRFGFFRLDELEEVRG